MFEKVLLALDFSWYTQKILDRVSEIPGISEVILLHVIDTARPARLEWTHGQPQIENTQLLLEEKKKFLEALGLRVRIHVDAVVSAVTQGPVSNAILEIAKAENVSLIIVGARGINPIQELLLGSVSSSVIRYAATNVLIMHIPRTDDDTLPPPVVSSPKLFSKVLVPTDFSRSANDVSAFLKTIPGIGEVVLLHVVTRAESPEDIESGIHAAQINLGVLMKEFFDAGIEVTLYVRAGDPEQIIPAIADEEGVSLIAMSAFGLDRVRELVLGSTTFSVVKKARKPVLILRPGHVGTDL